MARSEAQKAADKRYRETHKGADVSWGTRLKPEEAEKIDAIIKAKNMSRADFLRWAAEKLNH
nr:MAG TPA: NikA, BACTERIAL CONJUGATION, RELAXASE, DNA [Caudoviricetes sp.]